MLVAGCTSEESTSVPPTPLQSLQPVTLPNISRLATPVQQQLHDAFTALTTALEQVGTPDVDRAERYGQLGRLLLAAELGGIATLCFRHAERLMPQDHRWPYFLGRKCCPPAVPVFAGVEQNCGLREALQPQRHPVSVREKTRKPKSVSVYSQDAKGDFEVRDRWLGTPGREYGTTRYALDFEEVTAECI